MQIIEYISGKGLISQYIRKPYTSTAKKKKRADLKMNKGPSFSKEDTQMTNRFTIRCSMPLAIREKQIEATVRY